MAACLAAGNHSNLIGVIGELTGHPAGTSGLVMPWIDPGFRNLAGPPNLATCTKDIYGDGQRFSMPLVLALAKGLAAVGEHLHARGISHGDFYAHNVLYHPEGGCFLGDFGAASFSRLRRVETLIHLKRWRCALSAVCLGSYWSALNPKITCSSHR